MWVTSLGGGQVNPATGDFVFGVSEGFLIENGKSAPGARRDLIGRAIEVMSAIDAIADDFGTWEGVCGRTDRTRRWAAVPHVADLQITGRHRCLISGSRARSGRSGR